MAKQLPSVDTNLDTFYSWILKTNGLVNLCNTEVVTANNSSNGAVTTGNGYVIGAFGANTIVATELRGGNTLATSVLTVSTNTAFTSNVNRFDAGVTLGANSLVLDTSGRYSATNTAQDQTVDQFSASAYRTCKYVVSVVDAINQDYQATELLVLNTGNTTISTEYAVLTSNTVLCTFRAENVSGNVRLMATPLVSPIQITVARTVIAT